MATPSTRLILRFYGRFAFLRTVDETGTARLRVLAPQFRAPFHEHRPLMTLRRDFVVFDKTKFEPLIAVISDGLPVARSDYFVWDLTGARVQVLGAVGRTSDLRVETGTTLFTLNEFEARAGRPNVSVPSDFELEPAPDGRNRVLIDVTGFSGFASATEPDTKDQLVNLRTNAKELTGDELFETASADLVEFFVDLPDATSNIGIECRFEQGKDVKLVTVRVGDTRRSNSSENNLAPVLVFTHLCSCLPSAVRDGRDLEFTQYYNLLNHGSSGVPEDILVPCLKNPQLSLLGAEHPGCDRLVAIERIDSKASA